MVTTDLEKMIFKVSENLRRIDLTDKDRNDRNNQLYNIWRLGKKSGTFNDVKDLAKKMSMTEQGLREIIYSEELKNNLTVSDTLIFGLSDEDKIMAKKGEDEREKRQKEYEKELTKKHEKEQIYWSKYVPAVRQYIYWLKDLIASSKNGIVHINLSDFAKECGFKMKDLFNDNDVVIDNDNISENLEEIKYPICAVFE